MTTGHAIPADAALGTWVAIDIEKDAHTALIAHGGKRERYRVITH